MMTFKVKRDRFFMSIIYFIILLILFVTFVPVLVIGYMEDKIEFLPLLILFLIDLITVVFILWIIYDMKYIFYDDYLFVKGGPFRSKIPYSKITGFHETKNIWIGYRLCSSKDALEIFYTTGIMGSVIISPENKERFIEELEKRMKKS